MTRPDWYSYFDHLAAVVAERATCPRAACGAVLVDWNTKAIIATGYNGAPRGDLHCTDVGCQLEGVGTDAEHCTRTVHAEVNAVLNAARIGGRTEGSALFLHGPMDICDRCKVILSSAGVTRWYFNASTDV